MERRYFLLVYHRNKMLRLEVLFMARQKIRETNPCRVGCYLSDDTYEKLKVYAHMTSQDVGTVVRNILDTYINVNSDKFDKAMRLKNELIELRSNAI